jgi:hypothetical protein
MGSVEAIATMEGFITCINAHDPKGIVSLFTAGHIFVIVRKGQIAEWQVCRQQTRL